METVKGTKDLGIGFDARFPASERATIAEWLDEQVAEVAKFVAKHRDRKYSVSLAEAGAKAWRAGCPEGSGS